MLAGESGTSGIVKDVLHKLEALSQHDNGQEATVRAGKGPNFCDVCNQLSSDVPGKDLLTFLT